MPDPLVFNMPVKPGLPLVAAITANGMDAERELLDDVVDEVDRTPLVVFLVDLQGANASGVIDGRVLITTDLLPGPRRQRQKLHVDLDVMARDLFGVAARVDGSPPDVARQRPDPVALERAVDARTRRCEPVVTLEVPGDPLRTEVIRGSQVQDLLDELPGDLPRVISRNRFLAGQAGPALQGIGFSPSVE